MNVHSHLLAALGDLERAMGAAGLWSCEEPPASALTSQQPFACDVLAFPEWLQFIFIPRLEALCTAGSVLPGQSAVAAMAEVCIGEYGEKGEIVGVLHLIDRLLVSQQS